MHYRLSVDGGTASHAVAAFSLGPSGLAEDIVYHSVCKYDEPVEPGENSGAGATKKSVRGLALRTQRLHERKAERLRNIAGLAKEFGLRAAEVKSDAGQKLHRLRARSAVERVELPDLLKIFLKLAKRRGYKGSFRARKNAGEVQSGISDLKQAMDQAQIDTGFAQPLTFGQYLNYRHENRLTLKLKEATPKKLYTDRALIEAEFDAIWSVQEQHHEVMRSILVKRAFHNAIFFQHPQQSPRGMVGNCSVIPNMPRAPKSQPAAQAFRIEKLLADMRWGTGESAPALSSDQKAVIREMLRNEVKTEFESLYSTLKEKGCPGPLGKRFNIHRHSRKYLRGDSTRAAWQKLGLLEDWNNLPQEKGKNGNVQVSIINFLADLGSPDHLDDDDWHLQFLKQDGAPREFRRELVEFINKLRQDGKLDRLSKMEFENGRGAYSLLALKTLTEKMRGGEGCDEHAAIASCYRKSSEKKAHSVCLAPPPKTGNVVVDKALRHLHREINKAIETLGGPPTEAVVELMRDLPMGLAARSERERENTKSNQIHETAAADIIERSDGQIVPTPTNIDRWQLWKEMGEACPYCSDPIGLGDAMDGGKTNFEHILPRSVTQVKKRLDHLVLAHRRCNDAKGKLRTPRTAFEDDPARWPWIETRVELLRKRGKLLKAKSRTEGQGHHRAEAMRLLSKADRLIAKDFDNDELTDDLISEFTDRQYAETSWLTKLIQPWLETLGTKVSVTRGGYTAYFRRIWGLDTVIPDIRYQENLPVLDTQGKRFIAEEFEQYRPMLEGESLRTQADLPERRIDKRIDHRQHLIDALVIGLTPQLLYQHKARHDLLLQERRMRGEKARGKFYEPPELSDLRERALDLVRNCSLKHQRDHNLGGHFYLDNPCSMVNQDGIEQPAMRVKLSALIGNATKKKTAADSSIEKINGILSDLTRKAVLVEFKQRLASGETPEKALSRPISFEMAGHKSEISRVQIKVKGETQPISYRSPRQGRHIKYLRPKGYAYLEISVGDGNLKSKRLVRYARAQHEKYWQKKDGVLKFWKGDTVQYENEHYVIGMITADNGGRLCLVPVTEACTFGELKKRFVTGETVSGKHLAAVQLLNV